VRLDRNEHPERAEGLPLRREVNHPGDASAILHGSAVRMSRRGVLILGASGAGKSSLALRLIARGGDLVADDRVELVAEAEGVRAAAPEALAGLIEVRGVGILRLRAAPPTRLRLVVDLDRGPGARLPERSKIALLGHDLELIGGRSIPDLDVIVTVLMQRGGELR
jgi:HPr kinase/phosphorylase